MGRGELQVGVLAIDVAGLYKKFPNPSGYFGERELDGRMMGIEHKEKSQIRSLLPDACRLSVAQASAASRIPVPGADGIVPRTRRSAAIREQPIVAGRCHAVMAAERFIACRQILFGVGGIE